MLVRWFTRTNDSSTKRLMFQVFFFIISYRLRALRTLYFYFCKFIKKIEKLIETMFAKNFARNCEKKIILGTSDAWSTSHLSQRTSEPAYYILDCRILNDLTEMMLSHLLPSVPSFMD